MSEVPLYRQVEAGVPGWVAFFDLTKYPPSLAYFSYTLGGPTTSYLSL